MNFGITLSLPALVLGALAAAAPAATTATARLNFSIIANSSPTSAFHRTIAAIDFAASTFIDPAPLALHPVHLSQHSIARFAAAVAGPRALSGALIQHDRLTPTHDVADLLTSAARINANINSFHSVSTSGTFVRVVSVGRTIDLAVGFGNHFNTLSGSAQVDVSAHPVPGPCTAVMLGLLVARRPRRH